MIVDAPGPVLATSNKRDLADLTRGVREKEGSVFIFDPSNIYRQAPSMSWNPLSYIRADYGYRGSPVARADLLSGVFGDAGRAGDTRRTAGSDPFFDAKGDELRSDVLLAAALKPGGTLRDAYRWLTSANSLEPKGILEGAGYMLAAKDYEEKVSLPHQTKGGVWACALQGLGFVRDDSVAPWYIPDGSRQSFDPVSFVSSRADTLYALSRNGASTSPLVSALTAVVAEAGEQLSDDCGGRVPLPVMFVLDEAINTTPWQEIPKRVSHYGSRGLLLQVIVQTYSQAEAVWGKLGVDTLFSSSNIAMYMGGVKETRVLQDLSQLIGSERRDQVSFSTSQGHRTRSRVKDAQLIPIATVDELAALPDGRAWLFASKSRPVYVALCPWYEQKYAAEVEASRAKYGEVLAR